MDEDREHRMDQQQLHKLIEACRPGGNDLHAPDMAELAEHLSHDPQARAVYDRSQRLDAALGAAFRKVTPPAGLEQRLLAAVGAASQKTTGEDKSTAGAVAPAPPKPLATRGKRFTRRRFVLASAIAAALAGVALIVSSLWKGPSEITPAFMVAHTQELLDDQDFTHVDAWKELVGAPPRRFPAEWLSVRPDAWRWVNTKLDRRAMVFRLPVRDKTAYLFAMNTTARPVGLGAQPPRRPFPGVTGGWKIGAWTIDGVV
jgi:hypothetical protein